MDLNHLAVYVAVAEHNSFTRAADILGLPRSAVSRRVAALEEALGVELLIRTTRHVETTSAGRRLLRDVAPLLGQLEAAVHDLPERSAEPAGELRITAPPDLGLWLLPPVLGALTVMHPAVHPVVALSNRVVDLEREGFDVAVPEPDDPAMPTEPMLDLDAGYVRRAVDRMPRQGPGPWRVSTTYREDERRLRRAPLDDRVLRFSRVHAHAT